MAMLGRHEYLFGRDVPVETAWTTKSVLSGLVAGAAMAMVAMMLAAVTGYGFWAPPRAIAAEFFGTAYAGGDFAMTPVLIGMGVHMMLSALFGFLYAVGVGLVSRRMPLAIQLAAGLVYGLALWAVNTYFFAGFFNGREVIEGGMGTGTWLAVHIVFGLALAFMYDEWRHEATELRS